MCKEEMRIKFKVQMQELVLNDIPIVSKLLSRLPHLSIVSELVLEDADAALAWMFSQLPFVSGRNPKATVSLSWPTNMEAQDLFPLTSSTYTLPTGTKVDVPCFAPNKVVDIKRTECPSSFVNPMDLNHDRQCVKVLLHRKYWMFTSVACFSHSPCLALHT
jgi:hypothetical protein